ncbi:transmembrane transport protein [Nocardiopsis sp. CNT312]|uniref:transmembrane transport protein n=1 Tax=Nocardiopsis sp. CNT312 TaxID=1137268 RepID=UPI0004ACBEB8|nr:transmembrane transport protein [Nocardiopsis sp. CNT312]
MNERNPVERREAPGELRRALAAEVSLGPRMRHAAVGLAGGCGAVLIAVLWATEPGTLPVRTRAAFAALITVGLAWAAFSGWALSRRRPLFARDRVLGAGIALAAAAVTAVAGTALAAVRATAAETLAAALAGTLLTGAAGLLLARARARRRELLRLRDALRDDTARPAPESDSTFEEIAMNDKTDRNLSLGPLALALRLRGAGGRTALLLAVLLGAALLAGAALLLT